MSGAPAPLGWPGIVRLGLVQTALGSIVVLTTSTMNRVMVVELGLAAMLPGALVALHYAVQILRPRMGYGSDVGGRRTPWIVGGMAVLALGGVGAALATAWMASDAAAGTALAMLSFVMIGAGVGASGTSLLVLLAKRTDARRRAAAATTVWLMMIAGFVITATVAGHFLDPFSPLRLVQVTACVCALAFVVTVLAVRNVEGAHAVQGVEGVHAVRDAEGAHRVRDADGAQRVRDVERALAADAPAQHAAGERTAAAAQHARTPAFRDALREVWAEPRARRFAVFVFVSMLAYSAQDLILEPFAGTVFGLTPGESTRLAGVQHGGVMLGMILVALAGALARRAGRGAGSLKAWTIGGCIASAAALLALCIGGFAGPGWPLAGTVFALGVANGAFAVAAIGSMMGLVDAGRERREGVRMGLWGAAQAIAFGLGGFIGTAAIDLTRSLIDAPAAAYGVVFAAEAALFLVSAVLASRVDRAPASRPARIAAGFAPRAAAAQVSR